VHERKQREKGGGEETLFIEAVGVEIFSRLEQLKQGKGGRDQQLREIKIKPKQLFLEFG
jgi:hypothetical protein